MSEPRLVSEENVTLADLRKQVAAQAMVMAHLAKQIAGVYEQLADVYAASSDESFLRSVGSDSAARMEILGNMMNNMDIASEDDEWTYPIFEESQRLWPQKKVR